MREKFYQAELEGSGLAHSNPTLVTRLKFQKMRVKYELKRLIYPYYCYCCHRFVFTPHFKRHREVLKEYHRLILETNYGLKEIKQVLMATNFNVEVKK